MRTRRTVLPFLFSLIFLSLPALASSQELVHEWSLGLGEELFDTGADVATDAAGNVAVVGAMSTAKELVVAKYDAAGALLWIKRVQSEELASASSVTFDADGNLYVVGGFGGTINLGGSDLVSAGGEDVYAVRFDADGNHVWSWRWGGPGRDLASEVVSDGTSRIVIAGSAASVALPGDPHMFVGAYDLDGNLLWEERYNDSRGRAAATSMALDAAGHIIVTGWFGDTQTLGGGDLISAGMNDMFLAKYDADGSHMWSQAFGGPFDDTAYGVAVAGAGDIVMTGTYNHGPIDLGGGPLPQVISDAVVLARFNSAGDHLWSQAFGGNGIDIGRDVAVDGGGNIVMVGQFGQPDIDFGGGPIASHGVLDIFVARFTGAGAHLWSAGYGNVASFDQAFGVTADGDGNAYVTGRFELSVDFGGGTIDAAGGSVDLFLVKFSPEGAPEPGALSLDIKPGSCPNTFNTDPYTKDRQNGKRPNGVLPVALLGGEDVDVHDIDVSSLMLEGVAPLRHSYEDVGTAYDGDGECGCTDESGDGYFDLTLKFSRAELVDQIGAVTEPMELTLTGMMNDGTSFEVSDCVTPPGWGDDDDKDDDDGDSPTVSLGPGRDVILKPATPNPFNPTTRISYEVARSGHVRLSVYNVRGEHIATLVNGPVSAGAHEVTWEARSLPSGVYFYRIEFNGAAETRKVLLVK